MKIAVCDDDRTTREQIASLVKEQEPDVEVITFGAGEDMIKSQENFAISFLDVDLKNKRGELNIKELNYIHLLCILFRLLMLIFHYRPKFFVCNLLSRRF